jgi:hypothetical protein
MPTTDRNQLAGVIRTPTTTLRMRRHRSEDVLAAE